MTPEVTTATPLLVVQHNALVNARFTLSTLEMRFFLAMLSCIGRDDTILPVCRIAVKDICPDGAYNSIYGDVREMVRNIITRSLFLEVLGPGGERVKKPAILGRPLMGRADYLPNEGVVEAVFNEHLRPYLLELKGNFTKAQLEQLLKIKSPASHRIYWLLREYVAFGKRTVGLAELRNLLGLTTEYEGRFDHFRTRVLDRAQEELARTDLPFTYELIKEGRSVTEIRFLFAPVPTQLSAAAPAGDSWEAALLAVGVAGKSLLAVKTQLAAGYYDEGYIRFVLASVRKQVQAGKVKKEAGAVFKALADGYLLADYQKSQTQAAPLTPTPARATAGAAAKQRERLHNELADLRNTLKFVQNEAPQTLSSGTPRQEAIAEIQAKISALEQKLAY